MLTKVHLKIKREMTKLQKLKKEEMLYFFMLIISRDPILSSKKVNRPKAES